MAGSTMRNPNGRPPIPALLNFARVLTPGGDELRPDRTTTTAKCTGFKTFNIFDLLQNNDSPDNTVTQP
eukprot:1365513-Amorphochlora_amoeboformis.AAC.1